MKQHWQILKQKCENQNKVFMELDALKNYSEIHYSHYDWWAFPIDKCSSYGDQYKITEEDYKYLSKEKNFIQALRSNATLVCKAWGYDLIDAKDIDNPKQDQQWQDWPIRLYKMSYSLEIFNQNDLLSNSVKFAKSLIAKECSFEYGDKDLKEYYAQFDERGIKRQAEAVNKQKLYKNQKKGGEIKQFQEKTEKNKQPQKNTKQVNQTQRKPGKIQQLNQLAIRIQQNHDKPNNNELKVQKSTIPIKNTQQLQFDKTKLAPKKKKRITLSKNLKDQIPYAK